MNKLIRFAYEVFSGLLVLGVCGGVLNGWCCVGRAFADSAAPTAVAGQESLKRLEQGVVKLELANGLRVLIYQRKQAPIFTGQVWVRVGGVDEQPGNTGIAHMLEHMAFKGTDRIGTTDYKRESELLERLELLVDESSGQFKSDDTQQLQEISKQLQSIWVDDEFSRLYNIKGAIGLNAGTAKDYTFYTVSLPSVAFELWCWMESERLLHPVFRQFYKEREVVLEERRSRFDDSPEGLLYEALLATSFSSHPYRLPVIGWRSDVGRLTATDIKDFHHRHYRPDNMVIGLVGDLDPQEIKPMLERYFGRLPRAVGSLPRISNIEEPQRGEKRVAIEFDAEPVMYMAYHKPAYPDPADVHFTILHEVLGGSRSSLLEKELVQKRQLATSIYTSEAPGALFPSVFYIGATPRKGVSYETLESKIQELIDRVKVEGVSSETLAGAKRRVQVGILSKLNSNEGLVATLANAELLWGDWHTFFEFYKQILSTSTNDIKNIATTYLTPANRTIAVIKKPTR